MSPEELAAEEAAVHTPSKADYPDELAVLPVRDTVLFPHAVMPLNIGRESSIELVKSIGESKVLGVVAQRDPSIDEPEPDDLYQVGCLAVMHKAVRMPNDSYLIFCEGLARIQLTDVVETTPYYKVKYDLLPDDSDEQTPEIEALRLNTISVFEEIAQLSPAIQDDMIKMIRTIVEPGRIADFVSATVPEMASADKQGILETFDVATRLRRLLSLLSKEREVLQLRSEIQSQVQDQLSESQREFYLREQLKAIQKELGESDDHAETEELRKKIHDAGMPDEVKKDALRELQRLSRMSPAAADYTVTRTYLDWLVVLPWKRSSGKKVNVVRAKKILDEDHFDLEKVKERILDYLAVLQLKPELKGPILCLAGPPGVGKTSLGRSIARAMGRKFVRMSLGGVHDEAEIRGHRRTYIGALPGQVMQGIRRAGSNDPVFMLDEIDKLGRDFRGDPASALLEVLDPEQNSTFRDHYLDVPFDLSKVLFITTANMLDTIPSALRDRMEVLNLQGYTESEKTKIAIQYLIPRQIKENGLTKLDIRFTPEAILEVIFQYTREAGVRNLEREIGTVCRKRARKLAEQPAAQNGEPRTSRRQPRRMTITPKMVREMLGAPKFRPEGEIADRVQRPGVAVGLAWTPVGGDVLFIEASSMPGSGKGMTLTGHLGKVMQESMQAALTWVRAHAAALKLSADTFKKHDLHIHVPAGAIPKDGPSAGITVATALASLLSGRKVKTGWAMTGELTLSGLVMPVGGIKEKVLAARRQGIEHVILPKDNQVNVAEDLKAEQLDGLEIHYATTVEEALNLALEPARKKKSVKSKPRKTAPNKRPSRKPAGARA